MYGIISVPASMIAVAQIVAVVVAATVSAENKLKERLENSCNYVPVVLQLSFFGISSVNELLDILWQKI
jgi:hypothetical protein